MCSHDHNTDAEAEDCSDEVDLTNLIDPMVMLCGLLMVLMPAINDLRLQQTELPEAGGKTPDVSLSNLPKLEFKADGTLTWNQQQITESQLSKLLSQLPAKSQVLLAGDQRAAYGRALWIRGLLQERQLQALELTRPLKTSHGATTTNQQ